MSADLTPDERAALRHWSLYGQPGVPPAHRVSGDAWKTKDFVTPMISPWDIPIPRADLATLLLGFRPREMEDKWFVYATGPDARGNVAVHMHRSWTGFKILELKIKIPLAPEGGGGGVGSEGTLAEDGARVTELVWESDPDRHRNQTEERAREEARSVCSWVLGVKLA